jgi:hypothetical protein
MGYKEGQVVIDVGNSFADASGPSYSEAHSHGYLIKAWGVSADLVAASLNSSIEMNGGLMGVDNTRSEIAHDCDKATASQQAYKVCVTVAPAQALAMAA